MRLKDTLLLNYEKWNVSDGNFLSFGPRGYLAQNFRINSDTSIIEINSTQPVYNSPIQINIDNFNLQSITSFMNKDTLLVTGVMDVNMEVSEFNKALPAFNGQAQITDLAIMEEPLGTVALATSRSSENSVNARMNLQGYGNLMNASGNVYLNNPDRQFDAQLQLDSLQLRTLQGMSLGQLRDASGYCLLYTSPSPRD